MTTEQHVVVLNQNIQATSQEQLLAAASACKLTTQPAKPQQQHGMCRQLLNEHGGCLSNSPTDPPQPTNLCQSVLKCCRCSADEVKPWLLMPMPQEMQVAPMPSLHAAVAEVVAAAAAAAADVADDDNALLGSSAPDSSLRCVCVWQGVNMRVIIGLLAPLYRMHALKQRQHRKQQPPACETDLPLLSPALVLPPVSAAAAAAASEPCETQLRSLRNWVGSANR